ncbi:MAG: VanW family protein [Thermomicrobiales bacterium]
MEQTATPQAREGLQASRVAASRRLSPAEQRVLAILASSAFLIAAVLFLIGAAIYTPQYQGRVYRGVHVAGVDLGGLTHDEAVARLDTQAAGWLAQPLAAGTPDQARRWTIAPADLGLRLDTRAAAESALAYGRGSDPITNTITWFNALRPLGGHNIAIPTALDEAKLDTALRGWAPTVTYEPTNAVFSVGQGDSLTIVGDKNGRGIGYYATETAFLDAASRLTTRPVRVALVTVPAGVTSAMLKTVESNARTVISQPLTLTGAGQSWTLDTATLKDALGYQLLDGHIAVGLDAKKLAPFFDQISAVVDRPGANARLVPDAAGNYQIQPDKAGVALDRAATLTAIDAALTAGQHSAVATIGPKAPPIVAADLAPVKAQLDKMLATPLVVSFPGASAITFTRADIAPLIRLAETPDKPTKVTISLDPAGLSALAALLAGKLNQPVRDAVFVYEDRQAKVKVPSQEGRALQGPLTEQSLQTAILGATGTATPYIIITKPNIASDAMAGVTFPDRLGYGRTDYSASIATRAHNVELATERLNGALIPPGAVFSFNAQVGAQTVANGYQEAYGIALVSTGKVETVSSVAGGICQVSTTLLQGVFSAGLPILQRNTHLYWVGYATPAPGMQGLDATVDDQSGLDFQFANNTGHWIGIETVADGENVRIAIYGTDTGWTVQIDDPVISNIKQPDPKPVYERTHDIPVGQTLYIEHAADGFDAAIHRRVTDKNGNVVQYDGQPLDTTFKSSYTSSRDRYQVGIPASEPEKTVEGSPTGE